MINFGTTSTGVASSSCFTKGICLSYIWQSPILCVNVPTSSPDTCANIHCNAAYCITFQPFAVSISCERWFKIRCNFPPFTSHCVPYAHGSKFISFNSS